MSESNLADPPVGIVGLGLMGYAIAKRFLTNGVRVVGYDLDEECRRRFAEIGGSPVSVVEDIPTQATVVLLSLPDHLVVGRVVSDLKEYLQKGSLIIDTSTGDPNAAVRLGSELADCGVDCLDASISGNSGQLLRKEVIAMVGGKKDVYDRAAPFLDMIAKESIYVGGWGAGAQMKLVTNLVLGLNRAALAEGIAFATALGLEPAIAVDVLKQSMAYSRIMDTKGEKMILKDFSAQARLAQHLKDVRLILGATPCKLPLSETHRALLEHAVDLGWGDYDNSAVLQAILEIRA